MLHLKEKVNDLIEPQELKSNSHLVLKVVLFQTMVIVDFQEQRQTKLHSILIVIAENMNKVRTVF